MNTAIITSKDDMASANIKQNLLDDHDFAELDEKFMESAVYQLKNQPEDQQVKLYTLSDEHIKHEDLDKEIESDFFLFATRHRAASGIPTLTVHCVGNFAKAEFGGKDKTLPPARADYIKFALTTLKQKATTAKLDQFEVMQEATHHGPYLEKPNMFIEIGSSEEQWHIREAGKVIADTIIHVLTNPVPDYKIAIAFGGTHYLSSFQHVLFETDWAIGHACPKYHLENLDEVLVQQMMEKTDPKPEAAILDWKGMGQEKQRIIEMLNNLKIKYFRIKEIG